jgi:hypothetical protein
MQIDFCIYKLYGKHAYEKKKKIVVQVAPSHTWSLYLAQLIESYLSLSIMSNQPSTSI